MLTYASCTLAVQIHQVVDDKDVRLDHRLQTMKANLTSGIVALEDAYHRRTHLSLRSKVPPDWHQENKDALDTDVDGVIRAAYARASCVLKGM